MSLPNWFNRDFIVKMSFATLIGVFTNAFTTYIAPQIFFMADWSAWPAGLVIALYYSMSLTIVLTFAISACLLFKKYLHLRKVKKGMQVRAKELNISTLQVRSDETAKHAMYYPKPMRTKKPDDHS